MYVDKEFTKGELVKIDKEYFVSKVSFEKRYYKILSMEGGELDEIKVVGENFPETDNQRTEESKLDKVVNENIPSNSENEEAEAKTEVLDERVWEKSFSEIVVTLFKEYTREVQLGEVAQKVGKKKFWGKFYFLLMLVLIK